MHIHVEKKSRDSPKATNGALYTLLRSISILIYMHSYVKSKCSQVPFQIISAKKLLNYWIGRVHLRIKSCPAHDSSAIMERSIITIISPGCDSMPSLLLCWPSPNALILPPMTSPISIWPRPILSLRAFGCRSNATSYSWEPSEAGTNNKWCSTSKEGPAIIFMEIMQIALI